MSGRVLSCTEYNTLLWFTSPTLFVPWEGHEEESTRFVCWLDLGRGGEKWGEWSRVAPKCWLIAMRSFFFYRGGRLMFSLGAPNSSIFISLVLWFSLLRHLRLANVRTYCLVNRGNDSSQFCLRGGWEWASFPLTICKVSLTTVNTLTLTLVFHTLPLATGLGLSFLSLVILMGFGNEGEANRVYIYHHLILLKSFLELSCSSG